MLLRNSVAGLLLLAACGRDKEIAEKYVVAAEKVVAAVQIDAAKLVPERLKGANNQIQTAKDELIVGDYRAAMRSAEQALALANALTGTVGEKKAELTTAFGNLS